MHLVSVLRGGTNHKVYYNSVNLFGNVTSGTSAGMSAAFLITTNTVTGTDLRNNIFANSTNFATAGSKSYTIYVPAGTTFGTINHNDYFPSGTYGILGYFGADITTLAAWQTATGQDVNSISADPLFSSTTDLIPGLGSPVLAAGTPIAGVDYDYMNADRSDTSPTMGAYENSGDFAGPAITYALLGNTTSTSNRLFTNVIITDLSGVNTTAGTRPRVYYKKTTDANAWNDNTSGTDGWKYMEANGTGDSPFDFTIDYSKLNGGAGVTQGDVVQYFVVGQDLQAAPNVSINAGSFTAPPASVALTAAAFPINGTINSYQISTAYSGVIDVGPSETYKSLTADDADGLFKALNNGVLTGNLTVNIKADLTETGAVALNQLSEEPAGSNFTMTIKPYSAASSPLNTVKTISGEYTGGLIRLNGADRVTIDGRIDGEGNYLAFINTATTGIIAAIQLISLGNNAGATNNTIRNCNISTGSNILTTSYAISIGGASVAASGSDNDFLTIRECNLFKANTGLYLAGTSTGVVNDLMLTGNKFGSANETDYLGNIGLTMQYCSGVIDQNEVFNITTGNNPKGINLGTGVVNASFSRNSIHAVKYLGTIGYGGKGIDISTGNASSNLVFDNNLIYDISGDGWSTFSTDAIVGIRILGTTGGLKFYFNSVYLSGNISRSAATTDKSAAIYIVSSATNIDLRNNIFVNSLENTTGVAEAFAIYSDAANTAYTPINFNDYYVSGAEGVLGYLGAKRSSLAAWKTATGQDANSLNTNPLFISTTDLDIDPASLMIGAGTPIPGIDYDYENTDRHNTLPTIGAYEGALPECLMPTALNATNVTAFTANLTWTLGGTEDAWEYAYGASPFPEPAGAGTATSSSTINPITGLSPNANYQFWARAVCSEELSSYWAGPFNFKTLCAPYNLPVAENFDAVTTPNLPDCWAKKIVTTTGSPTVTTSTTYYKSSPNSARLFRSTDLTAVVILITPEIASGYPMSGNQVKFWARGSSAGYVLQVGVMTDPANEATFTQVSTVNLTDAFAQYFVPLNTYGGSGKYIAFRHGSAVSSASIYVDDILIEEIPSCPAPFALTATDIGQTTAQLDWTSIGSEESWNVKYGVPGFNPATAGTLVAGIGSKPYLLGSLIPGTYYDWYAQAVCGFENPKKENFWIEIEENTEINQPASGGGPVDEPGEDGIFYFYQTPENAWYNVWFYDHPLDMTRMKIIRMGFWVKRLNTDIEANISYVVNWSTPDWDPAEPGFPTPMDEDYIERSPVNGPVEVVFDPESPNGQWIELYYVIPDYNPEWVSVDIWGQNVTIVYELTPPPTTSPLYSWWIKDPQRGGILLHECLPKPAGATSPWGGPATFATLCGPMPLPLEQKFDGVTTPALPYCWSKLVNTTSTGNVVTSTSYSYSSPNSARLYNDNDASATLLLISPEISASYPMADNQVTFWARGGSAGYSVIVGVMSDPGNSVTFEAISTVPLTAAFAEYQVTLDTYTGSGQYLAFKHGTASTYSSIYIDDVVIEPIPSCPKPKSLISNAITQTSADLSWTAGGVETSWQVKYGAPGFFPATQGTLVTGIGLPLPYTLNGLAPNMAYQWFVRGICGEGDTSAWAGPGSFTTLVSPAITYTPLPNTMVTGNVILNTTIIGAGGIPQAGAGLPRVCWKNGAGGVWEYVTGTYVSGNQYSFEFGGGAPGDMIYYFVVAQDNVSPIPNVLASPSAGAGNYGYNPPIAGTPPTTPNSYRILQAFSGDYNVGSGNQYESLTGANGIFNALNNGIITGPVHVKITSNLNESGATALNALNYHIESFFDVFFELPPSGGRAAVVISGNYAGGLIRLNGADHVTFDGGPGKELTVQNLSTSASSVFQLSNGASWNTIKNCNISCGSATVTTYGVQFIAAVGNDRNIIEENNIFKANQGIALPGSSTTDGNYNIIRNNLIGNDVEAESLTLYGIYATYQTNFEISGNEIWNLKYSTAPIGISISYCNSTSVNQNYIHDIVYVGTGGWGSVGISCNADEGSSVNNPNILICNNIIRHITGDGDDLSSPAYIPCGIKITGSASVTTGINILYNSVYLTQDLDYGLTSGWANPNWNAGLILGSGPTGYKVMNNIFFNALGEKTGQTLTSKGSAIYFTGSVNPFNQINNNIYYAENFDNNYVGLTGTSAGTNYTLAQWQAFTGQDANSVFMNPNFQNDLLELSGGSSFAPGGGTPLVSVPFDYSGDARDAEYPTVGAHEYPWQAIWTAGSATTGWFTSGNWNTPTIPAANMRVTVPYLPGEIYPVITTGQVVDVKTIDVQSGASVRIETGGALNVLKP
jgi:hypothetical protein